MGGTTGPIQQKQVVRVDETDVVEGGKIPAEVMVTKEERERGQAPVSTQTEDTGEESGLDSSSSEDSSPIVTLEQVGSQCINNPRLAFASFSYDYIDHDSMEVTSIISDCSELLVVLKKEEQEASERQKINAACSAGRKNSTDCCLAFASATAVYERPFAIASCYIARGVQTLCGN